MSALDSLSRDTSFETLLRLMKRTPAEPSHVALGLGALVGQEVHLDEVLKTLVARVEAAMQADRGTLYLLDPARGELFSRAANLPELKQIRLKVGQGIAGYVAAEKKPVCIPSADQEARFFPDVDKLTGYRTRTLLAAPLLDRSGECFGVVQVLNRLGGGAFGKDDELRMAAVAHEISEALQATSLYSELLRAKEQPHSPVAYCFNHIIGESPPMRAAYRLVLKAAPTDATVLISGESGTGKELVARAIHVNSPRRHKPFVKVDCSALPPSLIENELFGPEKGAYTGAESRALGKFEIADGGTVFIDELGELPLALQSKLLRMLQDREFERVGGTQTVRADVRVVAATHRDLKAMVKAGTFRADLYYRVKVVELRLPSLTERGPEDIERLARHFVAQAARRHRIEAPRLTPAAVERLVAHEWPGNVRELEHCLESATVLAEGEITPDRLPLPAESGGSSRPKDAVMSLAAAERRHILHVLQETNANRSRAAELLGIGRNTLVRKLKLYGIS